jgi:hypothetical protein
MTARPAGLLVVALAACAPRRPATADVSSPTPVVTLERTPCFGTCPVYTVSISESGTVRFLGRNHVGKQGEATAEIPRATVDSLLRQLEAGGYFDFADAYVMDSPACGQYATDSPTVITSATVGGRSKAIRHDYGCFAAPAELARLERMIDEVAGTSRWTSPGPPHRQ